MWHVCRLQKRSTSEEARTHRAVMETGRFFGPFSCLIVDVTTFLHSVQNLLMIRCQLMLLKDQFGAKKGKQKARLVIMQMRVCTLKLYKYAIFPSQRNDHQILHSCQNRSVSDSGCGVGCARAVCGGDFTYTTGVAELITFPFCTAFQCCVFDFIDLQLLRCTLQI